MSGAHRPTGTAVFVDQSGRRRRVLMVAGVLLGTLMLATAAVLIGGAFSTTRLDAVDWPGDGSGDPKESVPAVVKTSPTPSAKATPTRSVAPVVQATPTPTRTATPTRSPSPAARESTRPPASPVSRTPTPTPSTTASPTTEAERTPPGLTKKTPGPGSDKTPGPKR
ncbi:hypothetical protein [Nonomuraea basaltis]|uniref:hypothetical protein n=1 Tax=Nonomuraea basaltis TaxID=2495887 RepID=UPI00110C541E|nr:hypothetical protein [Nonomuraea basaltis]TMR88326.1 hypothetical protein EJK15_66920 [Nonomuraea basaltis]